MKKKKNKIEFNNLEIIFMGTSFFAKKILQDLIEKDVEIKLVVTQPDKLAGRKKELKPSAVKKLALKNKLPLIQPIKLDSTFSNKIKEINPDFIVVASYGIIIPKEIIDSPRIKKDFINIHPSLLPDLRGPSPIQTALLENHQETGLTIMRMDAGVDSGDILFQKKLGIEKKDNYQNLEKKLLKLAAENLTETLKKYSKKAIKPKPQSPDEATFTEIIKKQDGSINWNSTAQDIYNKFRAFYLWPQVYTFWGNKKNQKKIILTEIEISAENKKGVENGLVYKKENQILVQTKKGSIILKKIKIEGKQETSIKNFINGYPNFIESYLN
jgi:methionyl-tRNA formyltransferase